MAGPRRVGHCLIRPGPCGALCDDGLSAEAVATGLGTAYSKALVMLLTAQDR